MGELIFESHDPAVGWTGTYGSDHTIQDGIYVWKIRFNEAGSTRAHVYNGHLLVLK